MMLVQTLLVRNEQDIIAQNISYHLNAGVDLIIVTDHNSTDATRDIIQPFVSSGHVRLRQEPSPEFQQSQWVTTMARSAHALGADWVINGDADEFWFAPHSDLPSIFADVDPGRGILTAHRHDFVSMIDDLRPFQESCIYRKRHSTNSQGDPLPPKVAHRSSAEITVAFGNHAASAPNLGEPIDDRSIEIHHFPMRTYDQFSEKVLVGATALDNTIGIDPEIGKTWRHLRHEYENNQLEQWYRHNTIGAGDVASRLESREIVIDTRLRDILRGLGFTSSVDMHQP